MIKKLFSLGKKRRERIRHFFGSIARALRLRPRSLKGFRPPSTYRRRYFRALEHPLHRHER